MKCNYFLSLIFCALNVSLSAQEKPDSANADNGRILSADSLITTDAHLDSIYQSLPEVMITGQRPIVKAEQGKLVYDLPRLIGNLPVDNAYDAVKELPGVTEMNGGLMLAGQGVTVVLDGWRMDARLIAMQETWEGGRRTLKATFGDPPLGVTELLRRERKRVVR